MILGIALLFAAAVWGLTLYSRRRITTVPKDKIPKGRP